MTSPGTPSQDGLQVRREGVQDDAPVLQVWCQTAGTGQGNQGPQPRDVTELDAAQIHVDVTGHISDTGKRSCQAAVGSLIDVPREDHAGPLHRTGNPQRHVISAGRAGPGGRTPLPDRRLL